jgi:hypothetical protein
MALTRYRRERRGFVLNFARAVQLRRMPESDFAGGKFSQRERVTHYRLLHRPCGRDRDANGGLVNSNDNWLNDQEVELIATTIPPTNGLESAIVTTLSANGASYTAIVRGAGGSSGIAVVEVYAVN